MKIQILSDLHLDLNRKKEKQGLPITFYILYNQIQVILKDKPDLIIINGDLINNQQKLDITILNFFSQIISHINKSNPQLKIIINQGNHDLVYLNKNLQNYGSFISIFKNNVNVIPITNCRKIKVTNELNLFFIPYGQNKEEVYKFLEEEKNFNYGLYFFHHDIDIMHNNYGIQTQNKSKILELDIIKSIIDKQNKGYHLINGHYHYHTELPKYNLTICGGLSQNSYSEKINSIVDVDQFFGWNRFLFFSEKDKNMEFIPQEYKICTISYKNYIKFMEEYTQLKNLIYEKAGKQFFQIRVENNIENVDVDYNDLDLKIKELESMTNVLEQKKIQGGKLFDIINQSTNNKESASNKSFDLKEYYKKQIKESIAGTPLAKKTDSVIKELNLIFQT